jgi:Putative adhesin
MPSWTVDTRGRLDFDDVTALNVRLMAGSVAVLASDDRPSMVVTELKGRPLQVAQEGRPDGWLDRLEANTMSGQIAADVTLRAGGDVRVSTMSGDVTLRLPGGSDPQVRLQSTSGAVRTEFESLRAVRAPASHTVSGNVGAGTGRVSVSTMSGSVTLLRRLGREGKESETR